MKYKVHIRKEYRDGPRVVVVNSQFPPEVDAKGNLLIADLSSSCYLHIFAAGSWARVEPVPAGALDSAKGTR
jgi:hypothetical protein